ncbi:MAG: GatB/YqeY domain-containing protein [Thermodesulfovibrionales bacterium]
MDILKKIDDDLSTSLKAKDDLRVSTLRMMKAALKNAEIEKRQKGGLKEEDITGVLSSLVKQRRESVEQYTKAGRHDLADKESREIEIIQEYLPEQLSEEELENLIRSAIHETGVSSVKEIGRLMKVLMPQVKGRADGRIVNEKARDILEGKR